MPRKTAPPPAPNSLEAWFTQRHPDLRLASFQRVLLAELERLALREVPQRRMLVMMPPGHGKTQHGTFAFAPWYLATNPTHNLLVLSYDEKMSGRFGRRIRNSCKSAAKSEGYPGMQPTTDSHAASYFNTEQGNECFSAGFNGALAGHRCDCILIDDPVKSIVEARSEARMEEVFDIYRSVVKQRLKPDGIIIAYLTRYGMRDFAGRLLEAEGTHWKQLMFPAEQPAGSGRYLWPQYMGKAVYAEAKEDPEVWWSVWQQQPKQLRNHVFREDWLTYWDVPGQEPGRIQV